MSKVQLDANITQTDRNRILLSLLSIGCNTVLNADDFVNIIKSIEECCYNKAIKTCKQDGRQDLLKIRYSSFIGHISANIDPLSNVNYEFTDPTDNILVKVHAQLISPEQLIEMESYQLNPARSKDVRQTLQRREESKIDKKFIKDKKCKFCEQKTVSSFAIQTKSLDEPKTIFFECESCNNTWT